jgi:hypothetical protein
MQSKRSGSTNKNIFSRSGSSRFQFFGRTHPLMFPSVEFPSPTSFVPLCPGLGTGSTVVQALDCLGDLTRAGALAGVDPDLNLVKGCGGSLCCRRRWSRAWETGLSSSMTLSACLGSAAWAPSPSRSCDLRDISDRLLRITSVIEHVMFIDITTTPIVEHGMFLRISAPPIATWPPSR